MSDSSSDESSAGLHQASMKKKKNGTTTSSFISRTPGPSISFTGSCQQPLSLDDDDDSDASSLLEILPPVTGQKALQTTQKATKNNNSSSFKSTAGTTSKKKMTCSLLGDDSSDSDDSFLQKKLIAKGGARGGASGSDSDDDSFLQKKPKAKTGAQKKQGGGGGRAAAAAPKDNNKQRQAEQKKLEKERKLAAKKAEQERKKAERLAAKQQKAAEKEAAKQRKKRQRDLHHQASGKHANEEIVLLVDPPLYRRPTEHNCYDWKNNEEFEKYNVRVHERASALGGPHCHALQWISCDHLEGGADKALDHLRKNNHDGYNHLDRLVVVFDRPKVFIDLLHRTPQDDTDDDYPKLRDWLQRLQHSWKAAWPKAAAKRPTLLLVLLQPEREIDRQLNEYRKRHKNSQRNEAAPCPPNHESFQDAKTWMLISFQVECMCLQSYEEIWTQTLKLTRALANAKYKKPVTELECIKRIKTDIKGDDPPLKKAKDTWLRQLQQIPGMSENKARNLASEYPTIQSLWQAYQDPETNNPQGLVANCLSDRTEQKMAERVYKLLTSTDPEEILN